MKLGSVQFTINMGDIMKKRSILIFILLCTQLYGCSNHASEIPEIVPFGSETYALESKTLFIEEKDTKESEAPTEKYHDDNDMVENTDISAPHTTMQAEEPVAIRNDSYYSVATDIPRAEVESYAAQIKQQFLEHDWSAISSEISYPITIADITYNNSTDFLNASNGFEDNLQEEFFLTLEDEDCVEMFCNWEGIMLGATGEVWISEVLDEEFDSQELKIIAIYGMLTK